MDPSTSVPTVLLGWVKCGTGRDELVAVTQSHLDELTARTIPCPACNEPCGPAFERLGSDVDVTIVRWTTRGWERGSFLRKT